MRVLRCAVATLFVCFAVFPLHAQESPARVTILYDAFGNLFLEKTFKHYLDQRTKGEIIGNLSGK